MKQLFVFILLFTSLTFADSNYSKAADKNAVNNGYKVESIGELKEATVAEAVRGALEPKGVRVINDNGKAVCEVWFGKEIQAIKNDVPGASFGQIPEGAFIGVINFPSNTSDFRGQGIKAGFYTMRFGLILQDGNHLGVSTARDFFLLWRPKFRRNPARWPLDWSSSARPKVDRLFRVSTGCVEIDTTA